MKKYQTKKVFVAGGQPTVTYVDRHALGLEASLREASEIGHSLITVIGPTKSGKTVLCRNVFPRSESIWIGGGEIDEEVSFWEALCDQLGGLTQTEEVAQIARTDGVSKSTEGGVGVGVAKVNHVERVEDTKVSTSSQKRTRQRTPKNIALAMLAEADRPIVIDDFHYISPEVQRSIIRALKQPIFDGTRMVILAVPHRAYDAVKVEIEMTGRVRQMELPRWDDTDLARIPEVGFPLLNVSCSQSIIDSMVEHSFRSPHLMQWFCSKLCLDNGVTETAIDRVTIDVLGDNFFAEVAKNTSKKPFDRLATGPRQRSDRISRKFNDGSENDIYIAVLRAISMTGPRLTLTYEDFRAKLRELLLEDVPQAHEVSRVLLKMTEIAKNDIDGEPVLEWDESEKVLHIVDPFFAFYLKWGAIERPGA